MEKVLLGAYQVAEFESSDLGEQFTDGGLAPRTLVLRLTTAVDEPFVNRTVTALLTENDQHEIIDKLQENLRGVDL